MMPAYRKRPYVYLVHAEADKCLFYVFGKRILIESVQGVDIISIWKQLDQPRTSEDLVNLHLCPSAQVARELLTCLLKNRIVEEDAGGSLVLPDHPWTPVVRRLFHSQYAQSKALSALQNCALGIKSLISADAIKAVWQDAGFHVSDHGRILIVYAHFLQTLQLEELNAKLLESQQDWLLVSIDEFGGTVGPMFGPSTEICWKCFDLRRKSHIPNIHLQEHFERYFSGQQSGWGEFFPGQIQQLSMVAQREVFQVITGSSVPATSQGLLEIDLLHNRQAFHPVRPVSFCSACSRYFIASTDFQGTKDHDSPG